MSLKSPKEYIDSLRDDRTVFYRGERVRDVTEHPVTRRAIDHVAADYRIAEEPEHRDLMTSVDEQGQRHSRYFKVPRNADDLLRRRDIIEASTRAGHGVVLLIKEIGTDFLFAMRAVATAMQAQGLKDYLPRLERYHASCQERDVAMAVAQTDVKGDRSLGPTEQIHPDYYLRVVSRNTDGIVVRGAKAHTTGSLLANEIAVLPTRALTESDRDYAVAFAVPANTKGVRMILSPFSESAPSDFHHPIGHRHKIMDTLTIFDDVFVPRERVFMDGEWQFAGAIANTFVQFHRFTAASYKLPWIDLMVGAAMLMADANGITRANHVREKLARLINYRETVLGLTKMSAIEHRMLDGGIAVPNPVLSNAAKFHFAENYHVMVKHVQDIAGGLLVTGPSEEDLANPVTGPDIEKYLGGKKGVPTRDRLRLMNLIRDMLASEVGGYHEILSIHAEGSLETQKLTMVREFDPRPMVEFARRCANLGV